MPCLDGIISLMKYKSINKAHASRKITFLLTLGNFLKGLFAFDESKAMLKMMKYLRLDMKVWNHKECNH